MLVRLDAAYTDTTAADLGFALGLPEQPALRTLEVRPGGGVRLLLRLLGASHQVVLSTCDGELTETVACLPGTDSGLPERLTRLLPGGTSYTFRAGVRRLPPQRFRAEVARLRRAAADPRALAGLFPGATDALTVIGADVREHHGRVGWWTAHAYPQTGELVETVTTAVVR
jgi:hypothetical protein